jgi:hypothetical protein
MRARSIAELDPSLIRQRQPYPPGHRAAVSLVPRAQTWHAR